MRKGKREEGRERKKLRAPRISVLGRGLVKPGT
jgi:hypothetical protein